MWVRKLQRYSVAICVVLAAVGIGNVHGEALDEKAAEAWVQIPAGWADSLGAALNTGFGGREVRVINNSPDFMTVNIWDRGKPVKHYRYGPRSGVSVTPGYGVFFDATVTRWRNCGSPNAPSCSIAGVYKFSALDNPNSYLPSSLWSIIPRP